MLYHVTNNEPLLQASVPWSGNRKTSNLYLICSDVIFLDRGPIPGLLPIPHNRKNETALRDGELGELGIIGYQSFTAVSFAKWKTMICFFNFSRKKIWNPANYEDLNVGHLCLEVWKRSGSPRPDRIAAVFASWGGEEKMAGEHLSSKLSGAWPESGFRWGQKRATFLWWFWLRFIEVMAYLILLRPDPSRLIWLCTTLLVFLLARF